MDVPFERLTSAQVEQIVEGVPGTAFSGLKGFFRSLERRSYKVQVRAFLNRWRRLQVCPACHGARLRPEALAVKVEGVDIAAFLRDARPRRTHLARRAVGAAQRAGSRCRFWHGSRAGWIISPRSGSTI